jgi:hypothetical protein
LPRAQLRDGRAAFALAAGDDQHQIAARHFQRLFGARNRRESPKDPGFHAAVSIRFIAGPAGRSCGPPRARLGQGLQARDVRAEGGRHHHPVAA